MSGSAGRPRRWVPEVVQGSAMDCGPAALCALLLGHGRPASLARLREAAQAGVDGTSIDALEALARLMGLNAEQVVIPADHLLPRGRGLRRPSDQLPALVVTVLPGGLTHFVLLWSRLGPLVQVMDPARGRRWVHEDDVRQQLYVHRFEAPASDWAAWAGSEEWGEAARARLRALHLPQGALDEAQNGGWQALSRLDAALRLMGRLRDAGAIPDRATGLLDALRSGALPLPEDLLNARLAADPTGAPAEDPALQIQGAVVLRVRGALDPASVAEQAAAASPEARAAAAEIVAPEADPLWVCAEALGPARPAALAALALAVALGALGVAEGLALRSALEAPVGAHSLLQRIAPILPLVLTFGLGAALELRLVGEAQRLGRQLEHRLRLALLLRLPRTAPAALMSQLISDLAERAQSIVALRALPGLAIEAARLASALLLTGLGVAWLQPGAAPYALLSAAGGLLLPLLLRGLLDERELALRSHGGALQRLIFDALQGGVAARAHDGEAALRDEQQGLITGWVEAGRRLIGVSALLQLGVTLASTAPVALALLFAAEAGMSGRLLLLAYWGLQLPALSAQLAQIALSVPNLRSVALRALDPLRAPLEVPEEGPAAPPIEAPPPGPAPLTAGAEVQLSGAVVAREGRSLLGPLDLRLRPGEHVAVVGPSGAGKSTLMGILLGWSPLSDGSFTYDGQPTGPAQAAARRAELAWVDPEVQLWRASLLENLRYGAEADGADAETLSAALRGAELTELLHALPDGLSTPLGEAGGRLSGGQGQRVRIGRALHRSGARLVLLDEATRGLDRGARHRLLEALRAHFHSQTLLAVSHDLQETLRFPRVLVLEGGQLVQDGPPLQLLEDENGVYWRMMQAELDMKARLWRASGWRRLRLDRGQLRPAEAP